MMRRFAPAAVVAIAALLMQPAHAQTKTYIVGSAGDLAVECDVAGQNIGGACFNKSGASVTVKISDAHGDRVPFWIEMQNAAGECIGEDATGLECDGFQFAGCAGATSGQAVTRALLPGTAKIVIYLDGPVFFALEECDGLPATVGSITIS